MLFKSIVQAALVASAIAAPLQEHKHHQHKQEKREVKVVTQTSVVVVTLGAGDLTTTLPQVTINPATGVSVNTDYTPIPQEHPASFSNPESFESATPASTSPASTSTASTGGDFGAGAKGITYTPYSDDGGCKPASQIASEVAQLSGYSVIRLYGVDCDQVNAVLSAKAPSQKIFAGIYDVSNIASGIQTLVSAVNANGGWDNVHTVSIGNELVNSGQASPAQIKGYVSQGKSLLSAAGYSGPVVSVDTFIAVINNPELCQYSDYMAVNAHAFFDGYYTADQAGDWVLLQIQRVWSACGGKQNVFVTETGWPSKGDTNGVAVPSKPNQEAAISSIKSKCGDSSILFTAFNDLWKADGAFNAEKYWGILSN
ncbi:hypothetical protein G9P44_002748 [Scheffersomyces stipitis]|nr:hypothetical protein G9P44_002748 [Scheffersomyces stipitis]